MRRTFAYFYLIAYFLEPSSESLDLLLLLRDNRVLLCKSRFPLLRLLRTDRRGKGLAVRTGVLAAQGQVVIFADADLSWSVDDLSRFMTLVDSRTPIVYWVSGPNGIATFTLRALTKWTPLAPAAKVTAEPFAWSGARLL